MEAWSTDIRRTTAFASPLLKELRSAQCDTLSFDQVTAVPMQMTPGTLLLENYGNVLLHGSTAGSKATGPGIINSSRSFTGAP